MKKLVIASHTALIDGKEYDGIGNIFNESLSNAGVEYFFVRHSMDGLLPSVVQNYSKGVVHSSNGLFVIKNPGPLRYVTEILATVLYFTFYQKADIFIGVNPLNAIAGVLLKKINRVNTCIFFTPDYSPTRFTNKPLNNIYHWVDKYCVKNADEVWSVSTKICEIRKAMGLPDSKNIFIPNVPPEKFGKFRKNKSDKYALITYGILDKQLDFEGSIKAVAALKDKFPKISLTIVGNGPEENRLKEFAFKLGVGKNVRFLGKLSFSDTLKFTSAAGIGLALYTGAWGFNTYGDSTKCREFFFFGLPVVSTDSHATVSEIKNSGAGIVVEKSVKHYVAAIEKIFNNYGKYSKSSALLGNKYLGIHKKEVLRLLS